MLRFMWPAPKSKSCAQQPGRAANVDLVGVAPLAIAKTFES
jgi:hypothetical protein